jgi:hypothetical protein
MRLEKGYSYAQWCILVSAFLCGLPSPVRATETLAQTTAWLAQNLPNLAFADDGYGNVTHVVKYSFDGCNMHVNDRMSNTDSSSPSDTRFYSITLLRCLERCSMRSRNHQLNFNPKRRPNRLTVSDWKNTS